MARLRRGVPAPARGGGDGGVPPEAAGARSQDDVFRVSEARAVAAAAGAAAETAANTEAGSTIAVSSAADDAAVAAVAV